MSTPIEPRDDGPIEEEFRPHLWRLRARLVTPPEEARVEADLDRLHRAARQHAHGAPTGGEVVAIPGAGGGDEGLGWTRFGQVAAALLLVVAVGGGLAVGSNSTPSDPLLADGAPQPDGSLAESGDPARGDTSVPGADASDAFDASDPDVEVERAPQDGANNADAADAESGSDGASGSDAASGGGGTADSGAGGPGTPTGPAGPIQGGSGGASGESGTVTAPAAPGDGEADDAGVEDNGAEDSGSQDPPAEPPAGGEIIAAPEPGELDGFGGQRPCPDGSISDDCLAPDQDPGEQDDSDQGADDDGSAADDVTRPEPEQPESPSQPTTPTE